jgi:flagellar basal body-associated protein FliL
MMMAKPIKTKSLKPQNSDVPNTEDGAEKPSQKNNSPSASKKGLTMFQTIILAVVMLISSIAGPALAIYFLGPTVLVPMIQKALPKATAAEEGEAVDGENPAEGATGEAGKEGEHSGSKSQSLGMNLPMDEFIVNLKSSGSAKSNQFLKAKMSLAVTVPEAEDCNASSGHEKKAEGGGGGHGEGGEGAAKDPSVACNEAFVAKMGAYTPTLRDIINTAMMKRSAQQLSTLEGQEDLKDELVTEMNSVLTNQGYTVQRVNLQDFIIQR